MMNTEEMIHECVRYIASYSFAEFLDLFNRNNGAVQAFATTILVIITGYSVLQTKRTIKEMKEARLYEFLPILEVEILAIDLSTLRITLGNIGKSVAREVKIFLPLVAVPVSVEDIGLRGTKESRPTIDSVKILALPENQRRIRIEYLDVFSRKITSEATLIAETREKSHPRQNHLVSGTWSLMLPE